MARIIAEFDLTGEPFEPTVSNAPGEIRDFYTGEVLFSGTNAQCSLIAQSRIRKGEWNRPSKEDFKAKGYKTLVVSAG